MAERERKVLKWMIGIISFIVWVAVGRGLIFGGDATDASASQQWTMIIWTIIVIISSIKVYKSIVRR